MGAFLHVLLSAVLLVLTVGGEDECTFSQDCSRVDRCIGIQDAACACRFGQCVITGNPFFRGDQCEEYTDCSCSGTPETCFCRGGFCEADPKEKWECHTSNDCKKMTKCKDKDCSCSDNLCEYECSTVADCEEREDGVCSNLATIPGYKCKCEDNLCGLEKLPKECQEITDCVQSGKCTADQPCSCTNNVCTVPWFFSSPWRDRFPEKNCRSKEDCNFHVVECQVDRCSCTDRVKVDQYNSWGQCTLNNPTRDN